MADYFQQLLHWVNANPAWAGVTVFLMAFAESLAIVGVIVPGVVILFAVGALIGAGALDFWQMVAWAVSGAIAGDGLSFWLGSRYQRQLTAIWPFDRHPATLERGIAFFQRYGGKSIAIGRFFGPVRAVIPLVAGMMRMPAGRFLFANVLSALAWAPAYLLPGMAFGASLELASEVALRLVILLVVLLASLWFLAWFSHRLFVLIQPRSKRLVQKVLLFGERHPWLKRIAGALGDPGHPESVGLAMLAGVLVLASSGLIFLALLPDAPLLVADTALHLGLDQLANPAGNHLMLGLSALAGWSATLAMLLAIWLLLSLSGLRMAARHWLAGGGAVWLLSVVLEYFLRQSAHLIPVLPDIYVLRATAIFGLAAVLAASPVPHPRRWQIYSAATVLIMTVALAQLYLGSTLPAVLHAFGGALIWVTAIGMAYRTHALDEAIPPLKALLIGAISLLLALVSALSTPPPPATQQIETLAGSMTGDEWWRHGWQKLAVYRDDVLEVKKYPLNLQFSGNREQLEGALAQQGWQAVDTARGLEWLHLLAAASSLEQLPVLPYSHQGRLAARALVKILGQRRLVLYLWPSGYLTEEDGRPIWIGEVLTQQRKQWLWLLTYPTSLRDGQPALEILHRDVERASLTNRLERGGSLLLVAGR